MIQYLQTKTGFIQVNNRNCRLEPTVVPGQVFAELQPKGHLKQLKDLLSGLQLTFLGTGQGTHSPPATSVRCRNCGWWSLSPLIGYLL